MSCLYEDTKITVFGYRMHTHDHGDVNSVYRVRDNKWTEIARDDPQRPQAFYLTNEEIHLKHGDKLVGRCKFHNYQNSSVKAGSTHNDEMCNIYLIYYSPRHRINTSVQDCYKNQFPDLEKRIPHDSKKKPINQKSESNSK